MEKNKEKGLQEHSSDEKMTSSKEKTILGMNPMKVLFAMEYVLQGIANPFQGITYHSFFRHFHFNYGLSEAATQNLFSRSYLAWSFKPVIGFLMDAFGKTKIALIFLLSAGALFYIFTPAFDTSAIAFFWLMFFLAILFGCTDVAVDRATVISGDEESKKTGQSKAKTVGMNQAICWAAIYGTNIIAGFFGGFIADNFKIKYLMFALSLVPFLVLLVVLRLPKDVTASTPIKNSVINFWNGLNTGPIVWIILFYFLFHFQPAMGALWTNYLMTRLMFSQTQIGISDGISYTGYFLGVLLFAWIGLKWQDKIGLKKLFKIFIILSIMVNLTQYLLVDPYFSNITGALSSYLPGFSLENVRLGYYSAYSFVTSILVSFIRMSTFSLVGAVIPINAAGSLFAGFMSVANLAYSFSYSSGSWLYENGMNFSFMQEFQHSLFGIAWNPGDKMSISMLIFIGSLAYLLSFLSVHMLPDKRVTRASEDIGDYLIGPEHFNILGSKFLKKINILSILLGLAMLSWFFFYFHLDIIASLIIAFFGLTFLRKIFLDWSYKKRVSH